MAQLIWDDFSDAQNPGLVVKDDSGRLWTLAPAVYHYDTTPLDEIDAEEQAEIIRLTLEWHGVVLDHQPRTVPSLAASFRGGISTSTTPPCGSLTTA